MLSPERGPHKHCPDPAPARQGAAEEELELGLALVAALQGGARDDQGGPGFGAGVCGAPPHGPPSEGGSSTRSSAYHAHGSMMR